MASYIGSTVRITRDDGQYEGVLHSIDPQNKRMTLEKVTHCGSEKQMTGCFHFFGNEIQNIVIIEDKSEEFTRKRNRRKGRSILVKNDQPTHLKKLKDVKDSDLMFHSVAAKSSTNVEAYQGRGDLGQKSNADSPLLMNQKNKTTNAQAKEMPICDTPCNISGKEIFIIDKLDDVFIDAVEHIKCQSIVGLAMEGVDLGRNGHLCWIQVATKKHVLLFDFLSLGKACLDQGLADILEESRIQKVIHDCRRISDMLHTLYGVKLVNVFDTQVADVLINKHNHHGKLPCYVNGLSMCLFSYLNLSAEQVHVQRLREEQLQEDQATWAIRPPTGYIVNAAAKNVAHLRDLRKELIERLLTEFTAGVDIYLNVLKNVNNENERKKLSNPKYLPCQFENLEYEAWNVNSRRYSDYSRSKPDFECDEKGFRENCVGAIDPEVIYSRDGILHAGDGRINVNGTFKSCATKERDRRTRSRSGNSGHSSGSETSSGEKSKNRKADSVLQRGAEQMKLEAIKKATATSAAREHDIRSVYYETPVVAQKSDGEDSSKQSESHRSIPSPQHEAADQPVEESQECLYSDSELRMWPAGLNLARLDPKSDPSREVKAKQKPNHGTASSSEGEAYLGHEALKPVTANHVEDFDVIPSQKILNNEKKTLSCASILSPPDLRKLSEMEGKTHGRPQGQSHIHSPHFAAESPNTFSSPGIGRGQAWSRFLERQPAVGIVNMDTMGDNCQQSDSGGDSMSLRTKSYVSGDESSNESSTDPELSSSKTISSIQKGMGRGALIALYSQ